MNGLDTKFYDHLDMMAVLAEEMIDGRGEDSFLGRIRQDSALVGVFDGAGGLGSRTYEQFREHTGAYMASRMVCGAVRSWYRDAYDTVRSSADELTASLNRYITDAYAAGSSYGQSNLKIRGSMVRDFPTTAAIALAQQVQEGIRLHIWWAGDSRVYLMDAEGLAQLTQDDVDIEDALSNLYEDGVMTNLLSSDGRYTLHYRCLTINRPTIVFAATDGCFGYIPSPMEFEYTVLNALTESRSPEEFEQRLKKSFHDATGDDFSFGMLSFFHETYEGLRNACTDRMLRLEQQYILPLQRDHSKEAIRRLWNTYRKGYERYL